MHKWQAPNINKDDLNPLQFSIVNRFKRLLYPSVWFLHSRGRFLHFWGYFIHSWGHLNPLNKEPNTSLIRAYLKVMDTSAPAPEDVKNLLILTEEITKQILQGSELIPSCNSFNVSEMGFPEDEDVITDYQGIHHIVTQFGKFLVCCLFCLFVTEVVRRTRLNFSKKLCQSPSLVFLTPTPALSSHKHRTLLVRSPHLANSPAYYATTPQEHFELFDVLPNSPNYSFSNTRHLWVVPEWPSCFRAQWGYRFVVKHSKVGHQTSSRPPNSASHLLGLQGPKQIPAL